MYQKLLFIVIGAMLLPFVVFAQGSITGTVIDSRTGDGIPGVNVVVSELQRGVSTNVNGEYTISDIPSGNYTLVATFIGYQRFSVDIVVGTSQLTQNITLREDVVGLEEVVVTGVGRGTETTKLGFSVARISERDLREVPASNLGAAIRAKAPGVTIVNASGDPASPATIRLRGSTSLLGNQSPLIIVDGVITDGNLQDINMQDVESIEVVKGAAAASLYGSLAGNGVIQILTKRSSDSIDRPRVTFRSEYGFSEIANDYPLTRKHPWINDAVVTDGYVTSWPGYENFDTSAGNPVWDKDYPVYFDNVDAIFTGQPYNSNFIQLGNASQSYNYMLSYENHTQGGVVQNLGDYVRNSVRFNGDYLFEERFRVGISASYINSEAPFFTEQGQGGGTNHFYSALSTVPILDFTELDAAGNVTNQMTGYAIAGVNTQNPLYTTANRERTDRRERIIAGLNASYDITDWLSVNARQSLDRSDEIRSDYAPVGFQTPTPSQALNSGFESRRLRDLSTAITEVWLESLNTFGDFNVSTQLKYLYENRNFEQYTLSGFDYSVSGIRSLGATNQANYSIGSFETTQRAENYIFNTDVDYQDKIIVGAMLRRDGSSSFGADERYNWYYRGSLAYRLTQDVSIDNVQELKFRASYGTSGQRPPFQAQYETYNATSSAITPGVLGNRNIKPSTVGELEVGIDLTFLNRFNFTTNYALTNVKNDYLNVPLAGTSAFSSQWQNVGEIENKTFEVLFGGQAVQTRNFTLDFNLSFDRTTQMVTDLGPNPPFTRQVAGSAIQLFRFEEGVSYGAMYGRKILTSVNDLTVVNGVVANIPGGFSPSDFSVNSLGHVVLTQNIGTDLERPIYLTDEDGTRETVKIGDTQPDFKMGLSTTMNFRGIGLYALLDWVQGGDVYNYSRQLLYNRYTHKDLETYTKQGYHPNYILQADGLYNGAQAGSHFIEDASFVKLRELALSYTIGGNQLGAVGNYLRDIRVSLIGRNLLTFTKYTGFDPEVALRTNATNFRMDEYSYPNFRTFSASVQIRI
jgi:TonB-linked SusC/RagA family outer membrane protein